MYNHELTLISYKIGEDEIGNETKVPIKRNILCKIADIGNAEFYNAAVADLKPEIKFIVHDFEYEGEKEVVYKNNKYKVVRTYTVGYESSSRRMNSLKFDEIELTCEGAGNG